MATSKTKASAAKKPAATRAKTATKTVPKTAAKKPAAPSTKTTAKTVVKKTVAKAVPKAAAEKKPTATGVKAAPRKTTSAALSAEDRYRMVQEAAYFIAEKRGFTGGDMSYWIEAEVQINKLLSGK